MTKERGQEEQGTATARGIVVAGLGGGSGKSVVAVGLAAAFRKQGMKVVPFKKGPDYIDAGWLQLAADFPCYNLDPYLMGEEVMRGSLQCHGKSRDIFIVEGNRGLYDGVDSAGGYSTAELAVKLDLPVLLVVDCTKTTRTVAAMVLGCRQLDPRVDIRGVVLNRTGTARHEKVVRESLERYTDVPVLGCVPRLKRDVFPQRHLGVTPHQELEDPGEITAFLAEIAERYLDLDAIVQTMGPLSNAAACHRPVSVCPGEGVRIGVFKDAAFQFYYPDNLEALQAAGAELVEVNALTALELPDLDGLYIGGGFPETSAGQLAANKSFRESVRCAAAAGLPIYAECGGLIYLGESIAIAGECFPLAGVFPVRFCLEERPQAHGYTILEVEKENAFYPVGLEVRGHEFRYSRIVDWQGSSGELALGMHRGVGFMAARDGLVYKNVLALYTHIHALSTPQWAAGMVGRAREYGAQKKGWGAAPAA